MLLLSCRPVIDPIASIFHRMLCGRSNSSNNAQGYNLESEPLPGSDSIEASRRRWLFIAVVNFDWIVSIYVKKKLLLWSMS